jgi:hypothetical protein
MTNAPPDEPPACQQRHTPESPKRRRGAPLGNTNRATSLYHSRKKASEQRDSFRRAAEREALAMRREAGLENSALARAWGRQWARCEAAAARLEQRLNRRGWHGRDGAVKPDVTAYLQLVKDLMGRLTSIWEQMSSTNKTLGAVKVHYVAEFPFVDFNDLDRFGANSGVIAPGADANAAAAFPAEPEDVAPPEPESSPVRPAVRSVLAPKTAQATTEKPAPQAPPSRESPDVWSDVWHER